MDLRLPIADCRLNQRAFPALLATAYRRRGFSFTEILFAIMILGIGFIMVAAMFPVAIQQTETSKSETVGAGLARSGVGYIQQLTSTTFVQSTPPPPLGFARVPLCVLRPTVVFPGLGIYDDQHLYDCVYFGANPPLINALPGAWIGPGGTGGTYVIPGEVWGFDPITATPYFGNETVSSVNSSPIAPVISLSSLLTSMASQNMVQSADPRFGWIAFYKRDLIVTVSYVGTAATPTYAFAPSAQVIIVATQVRNKQAYTVTPTVAGVTPILDLPTIPTVLPLVPASLQPSRSVLPGPSDANIIPPTAAQLDAEIAFTDSTQSQRAAEGAFVIIAADGPGTPPSLLNRGPAGLYHGALNGRIYRLGAADPTDPNGATWKFAPGYGPSASDLTVMANSTNTKYLVYIVGRGVDPDFNPTAPSGQPTYSGLAQDIAVYSTFISCPSN